ncbi:MAG: GyrI-like domain-containing protein [Spirochaetales bacterium]|nr:GyrI-like domain-containing protein [Spirochaetales bacterium]
MKHEWRKAEKELYLPGKNPGVIEVPSMKYFVISGKGNPNDEFFGNYIEVLYTLSYGVRMSHKAGNPPEGYFEYTVYPLEGVWDISDEAKKKGGPLDKNTLVFDLMIRQPDFVTSDFAFEIIERIKKKKPHKLLEQVRFESLTEGKCMQMMHLGSYDDEPASFARMESYCTKEGFSRVSKVHREIYLSDVRKVTPEKLKTVLRFKIV